MAYRRSRGKATKIEPAPMSLRFLPVVVPGAGVSTVTIDLPQCMSLVARRFYRQGIQVAVAGIKILVSTGDPANRAEGYISVNKLPATWVMSNAWEKSFRAWQRMNAESTDEASSVKPRFLDFKIYADGVHHAAGYAANLLPSSGLGVQAVAGEWESSKFVIPRTDGTDTALSREVIAVGASYPGAGASGLDAVSLIEGYAASRLLPDVVDPNVPGDAADASGNTPENWLTATFNEGTHQDQGVLQDLITENNLAPYPFENDGVHVDTMYPGGANQLSGLEFHDDNYITSTSIGGTTRLRGGMFPCGLLRFNVINTTQTTAEPPVPVSFEYSIQLDLVPGTHRGYLCEPMTEM